MPKEKELCVTQLRHNEYYDMQKVQDDLYHRSQNGEIFDNLIDKIVSKENICLAYRNIKANNGSNTPGTDGKRISDISKLSVDELQEIVIERLCGPHGYKPKAVRRVEIPKTSDPTKKRPLGIPCIMDRLIQQCIKQILEPICEAKFYEHSYGFRPNRSAEHAIARVYQLMQICNLHYAVRVDIKGFFDNVNHSKLIKQMWAMGIRDKKLIYIVKEMLKAPIQMPNRERILPEAGTPQGGIISPLLANIVLNELDHWVESQWEENPLVYKAATGINPNGTLIKSAGYVMMRKTKLKEMHIVRYADDFVILCRTKSEASRMQMAVTQWLSQRLKLEVSAEKTKVVNLRRKRMEFLGFEIKVHQKGFVKKRPTWEPNKGKRKGYREAVKKWRIEHPEGTKRECSEALGCSENTIRVYWTKDNKYTQTGKSIPKFVVESHISKKKIKAISQKLEKQIDKIKLSSSWIREAEEILKYNSMVMGIHQYCKIATHVNIDLNPLGKRMLYQFQSKLNTNDEKRVVKTGRKLTSVEQELYGKSKQLRYVKGSNEPIYPIAYIRTVHPTLHKVSTCCYTDAGRVHLHKDLNVNKNIMRELLRYCGNYSVEYVDNRMSHYSAQKGRCAVTGREFLKATEIHCHHIQPRSLGGSDAYHNLILIYEPVHVLIHTTNEKLIDFYMKALNISEKQLEVINMLRENAKLMCIEAK